MTEWQPIIACPENQVVHVVNQRTDNRPELGNQKAGLFFHETDNGWSAMDFAPTHWAPIRRLDPPKVLAVGSYRIKKIESGKFALDLYDSTSLTIRLSTIISSSASYLEAVGEWAISRPWTSVGQAIRNTKVEGE